LAGPPRVTLTGPNRHGAQDKLAGLLFAQFLIGGADSAFALFDVVPPDLSPELA
jgi:hypothetical protein